MEEEQYGNAVLSRYPIQLSKAAKLPNSVGTKGKEPRGALWVSIKTQDTYLHLFNTHLGLDKKERKLQVNALLGEEWINDPKCQSPVILCGDFNTWSCSSVYRKIRCSLNDVQILKVNHKPKATWFSLFPFSRIDHIFVSPGIEVLDVIVPNTKLNRQASDHLPLIVDLKI